VATASTEAKELKVIGPPQGVGKIHNLFVPGVIIVPTFECTACFGRICRFCHSCHLREEAIVFWGQACRLVRRRSLYSCVPHQFARRRQKLYTNNFCSIWSSAGFAIQLNLYFTTIMIKFMTILFILNSYIPRHNRSQLRASPEVML